MMEEPNIVNTAVETSPASSLDSSSKFQTTNDDNILISISQAATTAEGSLETVEKDGPNSLPPEKVEGSLQDKAIETGYTIEHPEVASADGKNMGMSLFEHPDVKSNHPNTSGSGSSLIDGSQLASDNVAQGDGHMVETVEVEKVLCDQDGYSTVETRDFGGINSPSNGTTEISDANLVLNAQEVKVENVNVSTRTGSIPSNDGSIDSIKQEAREGKVQPTVASYSSSPQKKLSFVLTGKSQTSPAEVHQVKSYSGLVDTAAPFESVKEAVSKFGGIVNWKAHKALTMKRREFVQQELQKAKEEIPVYKKQMEEAEDAKVKVLKELQDAKRLIEELKLDLEKVQAEEAEAKQDSELVQLRVKEMEQGIVGEASVAIKSQVDVAKRRHALALAELESVRATMKALEKEHAVLIVERDDAIKRAKEAVSASSDIERTVEDLTLELLTVREALESAHAAHMEAEEHRIGAALARDQDSLTWEKELKAVEDEMKQLNDKMLSVKDLQSKLDTASTLLLSLKEELAAYMEAKFSEEFGGSVEGDVGSGSTNKVKTHSDVKATVGSVKEEIEEVKANIEKAKKEVDLLKVAAISLKSELEKEKAALTSMQQREGMALIAVSSLEAEVNRTRAEIEVIQAKEREAREQMLELPKALQQVALEAAEAKSAAQLAHEELRKAKEEEEQVKASASTLQSRLNAALKEIEASKVSEKLARAAVKALQESEQAGLMGHGDDSGNWITLPLDEYYELSKRAHDAEEEADERIAAAFSHVELAKESESKSLRNLEDARQKLEEKKESLRLACRKEEMARQGKLAVEQELRKWRAERRKANDASVASSNSSKSPQRSFEAVKSSMTSSQEASDRAQPTPSSVMYTQEDSADVRVKKKRVSLLPRIALLLGRKKKDQSK